MSDQSRGTRKRFSFRCCLCQRMIFLLLVFTLFFVSSAWAQAQLAVEWQGERLSVTAEGAPLSQVLREVADRTGMEVRGLEGLQGEVSVHFSGLPLRRGLEKLLAQVNYLFLEGTTSQGGVRPALVLVFGRRELSPAQQIASGEGARPDGKLATKDEEERLRALQALALEGNEEELRKALSDPNPTIQAMALDLLAGRNPQEAVPLLVNGTKSTQPEVRFRALDLLNSSQADEQTVLSALSKAVADEDMEVKSYAIRALANRGGPEAVEYLRQALHDPNPSVRMLAIDNIVRAVPPAHRIPLLREAASDGDETVRSAASTWLEEAGSDER